MLLLINHLQNIISLRIEGNVKVFHNKLEKHSESIDLYQAAHFAHATNLVPVQVGRAGIPEFGLPFFEVGELKNNYIFLPVPGL